MKLIRITIEKIFFFIAKEKFFIVLILLKHYATLNDKIELTKRVFLNIICIVALSLKFLNSFGPTVIVIITMHTSNKVHGRASKKD